MTTEATHRTVETNGIRMHLAEAGEGPLVVLCHGFPESWYSWRHQLAALAEAGFHVVAPDMRGYGQNDDAVWYQLYFQEPGVAEAEYDRNVRAVFRSGMIGISGDAPPGTPPFGMVPRQGSPFRWTADPPPLPAWLSEADVDFYTAEFARTGFRGGLNWYRNIDRNWELLAPFAGAQVGVPALYIAGDRDLVVAFPGMDQLIPNLANFVPQLRRTIMLPGCGHWTQQERAAEVNAAMID